MSSIPPSLESSRPLSGDNRPVEDALNAVSDHDMGWWPFLELRPDTHEHLTSPRVLKMSLCYGPMMALLLLPLAIPMLSVIEAVGVVAASIAFTFFVYRFTFAIAWNRRAERLRVR